MENYDLIIIGAGSGGLTAASFARRLGLRVALVEKQRVGGDCTWSGCVPSKALLKAARVAHTARTAARFGVGLPSPAVDMSLVKEYVQSVVAGIYSQETPEVLAAEGIEVVMGQATFLDSHTIGAGERRLRGRKFLLCTGAHPTIPDIPGLRQSPFLTYEQIFENDRLPQQLLVVGAGSIGCEIGQAYRRLGAQVTLVDIGILPQEEAEAGELLGQVFAREGVGFVRGLCLEVAYGDGQFRLGVAGQQLEGDMLLVSVGRSPNVAGLALERAGVAYSRRGIQVNRNLRTRARHIYAAGDCLGGEQFSHLAAWQAVQAVRNAFLPGNDAGIVEAVPRTIFTDPEVAHVGLGWDEARRRHGTKARRTRRNLEHTDRAVCEGQPDGFVQLVHTAGGRLLGATVVAPHAGDLITEFSLALNRRMTLRELSQTIHPYPTFATAGQRAAADQTMDDLFQGASGGLLRWLAARA